MERQNCCIPCASEELDVPKSAKYLLIGSTEAYSGKSAATLGIAHQLRQRGLDIGYGKPLGTCPSESGTDQLDEDVRFIAEALQLPSDRLLPTLLLLDDSTVGRRINGEDATDYQQALASYNQAPISDLILLEGAGSLHEGKLFEVSLSQMAQTLDASVVLAARFHSPLAIDAILTAQQHLGDSLAGVILNDVPADHRDLVETQVRPFLEANGISVFGALPHSDLLRSVSVGELTHRLSAEVLCCRDRLDLMVESLTIGAMNVNSALKYFRKARNMAVVTGGDRTDLQLAALETSTQCLILTGHLPPADSILSRAEDLEIPILSVDLDTLTTVEIIDHAFGQVRLHETSKVQCVFDLMDKYFDVDRLIAALGLEPAIPA
jgi:BioD-like phosphotransacetylase family protein